MQRGYNPYMMGYQGITDYTAIPEYSHSQTKQEGNENGKLLLAGAAGAAGAGIVGVVAHDLNVVAKSAKTKLSKGVTGGQLDTLGKTGASTVEKQSGTIIGKLAGYALDAGKFLIKKSTLKYGGALAVIGLALVGANHLINGKGKAEPETKPVRFYRYPNANMQPSQSYYMSPYTNPYLAQIMNKQNVCGTGVGRIIP